MTMANTGAAADTHPTINFRPFDPRVIGNGGTCGVFGSRGSGLVNLARNLQKIVNPARSYVVCPSPEIHRKYSDWPEHCRMETFDETKIEHIIQDQNTIARQLYDQHESSVHNAEKQYDELHREQCLELSATINQLANANSWSDSETLDKYEQACAKLNQIQKAELEHRQLIYKQQYQSAQKPHSIAMFFDDIASDRNILYSKTLQRLCQSSRHYITMVCMLIPYAVDCPSKILMSLDYMFIGRESSPRNLERLFEFYGFGDYRGFVGTLYQTTKNYGFMVLDMRSSSLDVNDRVFYWQPDCLDSQRVSVRNPDIEAQETKYATNKETAYAHLASQISISKLVQEVVNEEKRNRGDMDQKLDDDENSNQTSDTKQESDKDNENENETDNENVSENNDENDSDENDANDNENESDEDDDNDNENDNENNSENNDSGEDDDNWENKDKPEIRVKVTTYIHETIAIYPDGRKTITRRKVIQEM